MAALNSHISNTFFCKIDLENFFGSINLSRITRVLKDYFKYREARELAKHSTVLNPKGVHHLPFGFPQSTLIATVAFHKSKVGGLINKLWRDPNITITVYVDDIIISSQSECQLYAAFKKIIDSIEASKFSVALNKKTNPCHEIEAFNIILKKGTNANNRY